jgi:hypothetical protein
VRIFGEVFVRGFADGIGFTSGTGLVAANVVARKEDTVDGDDFSGFDEEDVTDEDIVDRHEAFLARAEDLDVTVRRREESANSRTKEEERKKTNRSSF